MTQILAYVIVLLYSIFQELYIRDKSAKSFHRATGLDLTTIFYVSGIIVCLISAPILNSYHRLELSTSTTLVGIIVLIIGCIFRATAMRQLGEYYTRALGVTSKQTVIDTGLYAYVRHPGYLGTVIAGTGFGLAQGNLLSLLCILALLICVYSLRIYNEEKILVEALGEKYILYASHTKRLLPFVF